MEQKEILKGNKLIANFMGDQKLPEDRNGNMTTVAWMPKDQLRYHSSWDWIMPVVERIDMVFCSDFEVIIYSSSCHIKSFKRGNRSFMGTGVKIYAVWSCIVEFIKWHNANIPNK